MIQLDGISIERIKRLHPYIRLDLFDILYELAKKKIYIRITDGLRTYAEQKMLYARGRSTEGKIVTQAKEGFSWHNFGLAFDFCLLEPDKKNVSWNRLIDANENNVSDWQEVVHVVKAHGFEWGGDWFEFKDFPHFQKRFGLTIKDAQTLFRDNRTFAKGYVLIELEK